MNVKIVKHGSDPELAVMIDIDVAILSENTAAISGDRELVDILAKWGNGIGLSLLRFDIETDDLTLRDCRSTRIEGHSVTVVHFMVRD